MKKLFGFIDDVSQGMIHGWAWDPQAPSRALYVELTTERGDRIVTWANLYRADLHANGIGSGRHAFAVTLPDDPPLDPKSVQARILDTRQKLPNLGTGMRAHLLGRGLNLRRYLFGWRTHPLPGVRALPSPDSVSDQTGTATPPHHEDDLSGSIVSVEGGRIEARLEADPENCIPVLLVGGKPAWHDRCDMTENARHVFYVSGIAPRDQLSLWTVTDRGPVLCESRQTHAVSFERAILTQLTRAARVARRPGAVAVTCWEGGHNPIGRAKVLFDVLKPHRPVVLLCFLFNEFGGDIWSPLAGENDDIVLIPWAQRYFYLQIARAMGLQFDTVWMCKPRAPTFHMAAHVAAPEARLILDLDDNEEHFSHSAAARQKAYGLPSVGLSRAVMRRVPARTAASRSLVEDFDAVMVRHARARAPAGTAGRGAARKAKMGPLRIGFIGTVRPHKRILEAAREIRRLREAGEADLEFHVYGDIRPATLETELQAEGVVLKQNVPAHRLQDHLSRFDMVLSGFPSSSEADAPITRYQISAKIGDALAAGKPVLTPDSPSVADLHGVPGIFPFTADSFAEVLGAAVKTVRAGRAVDLPRDFTLEAAYEAFLQAESRAGAAPRGLEALSLVPRMDLPRQMQLAAQPTLFLVWKQHDGAIYGRRLDHICRAYQAAFPDHRVVVLEILYPDTDETYRQSLSSLSEFSCIRTLNMLKQQGGHTDRDGVEYHQLRLGTSVQLHQSLLDFLISHGILPTNAVAVLFPNILHLERVYDILCLYPLVTDVVDNQLAWASRTARMNVIGQYFTLAQISDRVVFNSATNRTFFEERAFLDPGAGNVSVIPNWYQFPRGFSATALTVGTGHQEAGGFDIFYSGNMNDRVDWDLLHQIAGLDPRIRLHLIGEAHRSQDALGRLLERDNVIFHGPQTEEMTLQLLARAALTVMPHVVDEVSTYMNPLKVHMYRALGLDTLSTDISGIEADDHLTVHADHAAFLTDLANRLDRPPRRRPVAENMPANAQAYIELIAALREEKQFTSRERKTPRNETQR